MSLVRVFFWGFLFTVRFIYTLYFVFFGRLKKYSLFRVFYVLFDGVVCRVYGFIFFYLLYKGMSSFLLDC